MESAHALPKGRLTQNDLICALKPMNTIDPVPAYNGGSARGYQPGLRVVGRLAAAVTDQQTSDPLAVYSCIGALGPDARICRVEVRSGIARKRRTRSRASSRARHLPGWEDPAPFIVKVGPGSASCCWLPLACTVETRSPELARLSGWFCTPAGGEACAAVASAGGSADPPGHRPGHRRQRALVGSA
jgi:hypothetical protein